MIHVFPSRLLKLMSRISLKQDVARYAYEFQNELRFYIYFHLMPSIYQKIHLIVGLPLKALRRPDALYSNCFCRIQNGTFSFLYRHDSNGHIPYLIVTLIRL